MNQKPESQLKVVQDLDLDLEPQQKEDQLKIQYKKPDQKNPSKKDTLNQI